MKALKTVGMLIIAVALFAFSPIEPKDVAGTYGGDTEGSKIELKLLANGNFTYVDNSDSANEVAVKGTWELDKNTITLSNFGTEANIHDKWKVDEEGKSIKSRKGMTFYRLTSKENCAPKSCCSKSAGKSCSGKK